MSTSPITFAALTDVGRKREHNEDNYLADPNLSLFVVCDGMGGHAAGEVASAMAVHTLHEEIKREADLLQDYRLGKQGAAKVSRRDISNMLEFATNRASSKIHAEANSDPSKRGMGTTLVAILFAGSQAFIIHVGDSRAYLLRNNLLEQLTNDHNVHNELIRSKKLSLEQIRNLAPKNAITRAVGVYQSCEPDTLVIDVVAGDRFLLCTDGLSEYFHEPNGSPEELGRALESPDAEETTRQLIQIANDRGGKDNITALIVTVGEVGVEDTEGARRAELKKHALSQVSLFRALDELEVHHVLQLMEVAAYQDGNPIITEGEPGEELFIVLIGEVEVLHGGIAVNTLTMGEHFGEMALLRSQPRSATVVSKGESELLVMRRADFLEIIRTQPRIAVKLLWQFTSVLADRLAETTRSLGSAREELAEEIQPEDFQEDPFDDDDLDRLTIRIPPPPLSLDELTEEPVSVESVELDDEEPPPTES